MAFNPHKEREWLKKQRDTVAKKEEIIKKAAKGAPYDLTRYAWESQRENGGTVADNDPRRVTKKKVPADHMNRYDKLYYDTHNEHQKALKEKSLKKGTIKKKAENKPKKGNTSFTARNAANAKLQTAKKVMDSKY